MDRIAANSLVPQNDGPSSGVGTHICTLQCIRINDKDFCTPAPLCYIPQMSSKMPRNAIVNHEGVQCPIFLSCSDFHDPKYGYWGVLRKK